MLKANSKFSCTFYAETTTSSFIPPNLFFCRSSTLSFFWLYLTIELLQQTQGTIPHFGFRFRFNYGFNFVCKYDSGLFFLVCCSLPCQPFVPFAFFVGAECNFYLLVLNFHFILWRFALLTQFPYLMVRSKYECERKFVRLSVIFGLLYFFDFTYAKVCLLTSWETAFGKFTNFYWFWDGQLIFYFFVNREQNEL